MNEILNEAIPKQWQKTSYFVLLVAVVVGGAAVVLGTSVYLPQLDYLSDEHRAEILKTMFDGWATLSSIVVGGNVVARGGLTLLKQWLQNQLVKSAAGIPEAPQTVNAGGDVNLGAEEMPVSQHQLQKGVASPALVVEELPKVLPVVGVSAEFDGDATVPRNGEGADDFGGAGEDYERTPG